jgi:predicted ATP-grasp superfamily ATP-dependent carboligase
VPPLRRADSPPATNDPWLLKDTRSSGGLGVEVWEGTAPLNADHRQWYFQQRIVGRSIAVVFLAASAKARLLGVTDQLVAARWCGARPFVYCGSVGPLRLSPHIAAQLESVGACLAREYQLQGLFGVDIIRDRHGRCWPVDINPRYPASAEVLELASGVSFVGLHVHACRTGELPPPRRLKQRGFAGKAIVYAAGDFIVSAAQNHRWHAANESPSRRPLARRGRSPLPRYRVADIPAAGTAIPGGSPIVTLVERGNDVQSVRRELRRRAVALRRRLQESGLHEPSSLRTA